MPIKATFSTRHPPYALIVVIALAVRIAVIPFVYQDWMDPFVLKHWAFGRIARSIALGHGFGSPFADTGLSALLPPVYSYLLAGIFKIFGIETRASVLAALSLNSVFSALTCVPVFLFARRGRSANAWRNGPVGDVLSHLTASTMARTGPGPPPW